MIPDILFITWHWSKGIARINVKQGSVIIFLLSPTLKVEKVIVTLFFTKHLKHGILSIESDFAQGDSKYLIVHMQLHYCSLCMHVHL